jgi:hypothetical protein
MKQDLLSTFTHITRIDERVILRTEKSEDNAKEIACINEAQAVGVEKLLKSLWGVRQA